MDMMGKFIKLSRKNISYGLLMFLIYMFVLFIISLIFGFEGNDQGPSLLSSIVFALVMGGAAYLLLKRSKPESNKDAYQKTIIWAVTAFLIVLIITIPNGTTTFFFGSWFNWLSFLAIGVAPILNNVLGKRGKDHEKTSK